MLEISPQKLLNVFICIFLKLIRDMIKCIKYIHIFSSIVYRNYLKR